MILSFDLSTSCCGVTKLDEQKKIVLCEALNFNNKKHFPTFFSKVQRMENYIKDLKTQYKIDEIAIEAPLMNFKKGQSNMKIIGLLLRFNGIISWLVYSIFEKEPHMISATSARKKIGISIPKGQNAKKYVMKHLLQYDPEFSRLVQFTKHGNPKPSNYDQMDSYVIGKSFLTK